MLVDVTSLMQRERSALRLLYELLVLHYPNLPLGEFLPMRGGFATDPAVIRRADDLYKRKYGFQRALINWLNALRGRKDTPVLIELTPESA